MVKGRLSGRYRLLITGIGISVFYWFVESIYRAFVLGEGTFTAQLIPEAGVFGLRLIVISLIIITVYWSRRAKTGVVNREHKAGQSSELISKEELYKSLITNIPGVVYRCDCNQEWTMRFLNDEIH